MARPCKSAKVLTDKSQTKAEINARIEMEDRLGGGRDKIRPPSRLCKEQKKIFRNVVNLLEDADILRTLDVEIVARYAFALDMIIRIEGDITAHPIRLTDKDYIAAYDKYTKIYFRCCNELSLSPQSRAKIANASAAANDGTAELMKILQGDDL
jgi:P27 family predicted phage terminase small subunit